MILISLYCKTMVKLKTIIEIIKIINHKNKTLKKLGYTILILINIMETQDICSTKIRGSKWKRFSWYFAFLINFFPTC